MKPVVSKERVKCRPIVQGDLDGVADLLAWGFEGRSRASFRAGLQRMAARIVPKGAPQFGYCLVAGERLIGVILLIASMRQTSGTPAIFCNVASWYVLPEFRTYAQFLVSVALRHKDFTYTNVTPAPQTWDIVEKQEYMRY